MVISTLAQIALFLQSFLDSLVPFVDHVSLIHDAVSGAAPLIASAGGMAGVLSRTRLVQTPIAAAKALPKAGFPWPHQTGANYK